jgi:acyl carrier protein
MHAQDHDTSAQKMAEEGGVKQIQDTIRNYILSTFLPGESAANLGDDTPLRTSSLLDSLATLRLVTFVEEQFGITVEAHEASIDNFDRIADIAAFVERKRNGEA